MLMKYDKVSALHMSTFPSRLVCFTLLTTTKLVKRLYLLQTTVEQCKIWLQCVAISLSMKTAKANKCYVFLLTALLRPY